MFGLVRKAACPTGLRTVSWPSCKCSSTVAVKDFVPIFVDRTIKGKLRGTRPVNAGCLVRGLLIGYQIRRAPPPWRTSHKLPVARSARPHHDQGFPSGSRASVPDLQLRHGDLGRHARSGGSRPVGRSPRSLTSQASSADLCGRLSSGSAGSFVFSSLCERCEWSRPGRVGWRAGRCQPRFPRRRRRLGSAGPRSARSVGHSARERVRVHLLFTRSL